MKNTLIKSAIGICTLFIFLSFYNPVSAADLCSNLSGTQSTVPTGYVRNISTGRCDFTGYTCPLVDAGNGYSVSVLISPNSNGGDPNTSFSTNLCSSFTATAINNLGSGTNLPCGNTHFVGALQWNATYIKTPVAGVCGTSNGKSLSSAPSTNLCSKGSNSTVSTNSSTYTWSCYGTNGGATASCSATRLLPENGVCGVAKDTCTKGTFGDTGDTSTQYKWNCNGTNGGSNVACSAVIPINGSCGTTNNSCVVGSLSDIADTSTQYKWNCNGANGGVAASCVLNKPIPGACGAYNNQTGTWPTGSSWCSPSTTSPSPWTQTGDTSANGGVWKWTCPGTYGGVSSPTCQFTQTCPSGQTLVNGQCLACGSANGVVSFGFPSSNLCSAGTATNQAPSTTSANHTWKCTINTSSLNCSAPRCVSGQTYCSSTNSCVTTGTCAVNTLNVNSSGVTGGVAISSNLSGIFGGTTSYVKTSSSDINTVLTAPIVSGFTFDSWGGSCDSTSNIARTCNVLVAGGFTKTVQANYNSIGGGSCSQIVNTSSLTPSIVETPSNMCLLKATSQNGSDASCKSKITCRLDGALISTSTLMTGKGINVGTHSLVCSDTFTTATSTLRCRLNPAYGEF